MDDTRFDAFARMLGGRVVSRRGVLQRINAGLVGAGLGVWGLHDGLARRKKKKKKKKKCTPPQVKCGKKCCAPTTCVSQSVCGTNCKCFFDVNSDLACYDLSSQGTCCDSTAECGPNHGCVSGACSGGGQAGACFALCTS